MVWYGMGDYVHHGHSQFIRWTVIGTAFSEAKRRGMAWHGRCSSRRCDAMVCADKLFGGYTDTTYLRLDRKIRRTT